MAKPLWPRASQFSDNQNALLTGLLEGQAALTKAESERSQREQAQLIRQSGQNVRIDKRLASRIARECVGTYLCGLTTLAGAAPVLADFAHLTRDGVCGLAVGTDDSVHLLAHVGGKKWSVALTEVVA